MYSGELRETPPSTALLSCQPEALYWAFNANLKKNEDFVSGSVDFLQLVADFVLGTQFVVDLERLRDGPEIMFEAYLFLAATDFEIYKPMGVVSPSEHNSNQKLTPQLRKGFLTVTNEINMIKGNRTTHNVSDASFIV